MARSKDDFSDDPSRVISARLPPARLEELRPRLQALLRDFAHLAELETPDLEPLPAFVVQHSAGDQDE